MSDGFNLAKAYFRARVAELPAGTFAKEWTDTFGVEVPASIADGAWHLSGGESNTVARNQVDLTHRATVRVQAFFKGFRTVEVGFERAEAAAKALIRQLVTPEKATTQANELKNVEFRSKSVTPQSGSNDNLVLLTLDFDVLLVFNTQI